MDDDGRVTYFNESARRTFGYAQDQVLGRELADLIVPPAARERHRIGLARYLATREPSILDRRIELVASRADGSEFPVELTVTRAAPGGAGFTGFVRDITQRLQSEEELKAARRRVIESADAARERVTRDIHDGAQQQFVNTLINLQLAQQKWSSDPQRARELVDLALQEATAGLASLRELAAGIHPAVLRDRGLGAALEALVTRMPIIVTLDVTPIELPRAFAASVYFFCSEALTNVVKHAAAARARVEVSASARELTIEVSDDGVGGATLESDGSGLIGLRDRVAALGGQFGFHSPPDGGGTTVTAKIPLPA